MDTRKLVYAAVMSAAVGVATPVVANAMSAGDWEGFYIGANVGHVEDKGVHYEVVGTPLVTNDFDLTGTGFGIQGGYNWAVGPVIIGVEGNASAVKADGAAPCPNPSYTCGAEMDQLYSMHARVGFPFDSFLLYGVAGVAQGKVEARAVRLSTGVNYGNSGTQSGLVAGIGGEFAFAQNIIGRLEVNYIDLGNNDYVVQGTPIKMDTKLTSARIGASWKF